MSTSLIRVTSVALDHNHSPSSELCIGELPAMKETCRRDFLRRAGGASVSVMLCPLYRSTTGLASEISAAKTAAADPSIPDDAFLRNASRIHQSLLTIDSHVDIFGTHYATAELDPGVDNPELKCDLVKMVTGGVDGVFLAVYTGQGPRDPEAYRNVHQQALDLLEAIHRLIRQYPDRCELATSPDAVERITESGKRAIMIGLENGYPIGTDLANVEKFYRLGVRYITLSHNGHNQICDSCFPRSQLGAKASEHNGLSPFGRQVVAEMNRLGILIDVSHIASKSFRDVIALSRTPIIASHSGCRSLYDHPRNLDDTELRLLAEKGGVVQVVAVPEFLTPGADERQKALEQLARQTAIPGGAGRPDLDEATAEQRKKWQTGVDEIARHFQVATLDDYVDHIDHAVRIAGVDHVGIGSDFDGGGGIQAFDNHADSPNVTMVLLRRGYSEQEIARIWGGNLLRVWREVQKAENDPPARPSAPNHAL